MKYFVLLAGRGETTPWDAMTPEEQEAELAKHDTFAKISDAREGVGLLGGNALGEGHTATTLRTRGANMTITDGPFAEAAEHIGGYYVLESPNLDATIEMCRHLPAYDIEIRPIVEP